MRLVRTLGMEKKARSMLVNTVQLWAPSHPIHSLCQHGQHLVFMHMPIVETLHNPNNFL